MQVVHAQETPLPLAQPGIRIDTIRTTATQPYRLQPFIIPGSETVTAGEVVLDSTAYRLDYRNGLLSLTLTEPDPSAVLVVRYRTSSYSFQEVYLRRRLAEAGERDSTAAPGVVEEVYRAQRPIDPFGDARLQRSGSITRGILAGNNRDVTVESGLRMQLSGEITDGVSVQAVLTDENTPIQPEGTTQRIDEFDKVFIEIATDKGTAQLGDFDLAFEQSEFARFTRKLQGITVFGALPNPKGALFAGGSAAVAGATARGIFRSQDLIPLDGVQGPYRLEGQNGERFIIVIPGSEVVYQDGQRLTRGESNDYVIDYATGEITFTPRRLLTADRRLTVEFQYSTNQFTRTLVGTEVQARFWEAPSGTARARLGVTYIREADGRQFNEEFGLTGADSLLIVGAGDAPALRSGAEVVLFDPEAPYVQYVQETRAVAGGIDTLFVALQQVPGPDRTVYRVRFRRVGSGMGRYVREGQSVNGIVYVYRGRGMGEYEPDRLLPKPKRQQLFDLHASVEPVKGVELFGEWARSLNDLNRLSDLDAEDDADDAGLAGLRVKPFDLTIGGLRFGTLEGLVRRRITGASFTSFDRTRPVEFGRQWNLLSRQVNATGGAGQAGDEVTDEAQVQFKVSPGTGLKYTRGRLELGEDFSGERQVLEVTAAEGAWPALEYRLEDIGSLEVLQAEEGAWVRQLGRLSKPLLQNKLTTRLEVEHEQRRQLALGTDSLLRPSFAFLEVRPGVTWQREALELGAELERRTEDRWAEGELRDAATAWTLQTNARYRAGQLLNTNATLGYRVNRYEAYFRVQEKQENTESVVVQWNGDFRPLERAVDLNWFYEAQTERTPTLQEIYVRTGPERGEFVWEDANADGILQIDEFLPERTPDEGSYVRTFVPSDSLTAVISVQARVRLRLDPSTRWAESTAGWQRVLSNVTSQTTVEVQEKSREPDLRQIYLLNLHRFRDPLNTLNGRLRIGQDFYLFRRETRYGLDLSFSQVRGLTELTAGEEERFINIYRAEGRYRLQTRWNLKVTAARERNRVLSETFASRRYDIQSLNLYPEMSFQPSPAFRVSGGVSYARKKDGLAGRRADVLRVPFEGRYSRVRKMQLTGRFEVAQVALEGEAVGLAQFELTEGRGPGTSFLWGINGQYAVNTYLRATVAYDGRAPADAPVLHTLRLQLSAVF